MAEPSIEIDVADVNGLRETQTPFVLLDVREMNENDFCKIDGSLLIPMSELKDRVSELDQHRDDHIVVHCHHGGRSLHVTNFLRESGFTNVQNMTGGIDAWSQQIDSSVERY